MNNTMNHKPYFYSILNPTKLQADRLLDGTLRKVMNLRTFSDYSAAEDSGLIEILSRTEPNVLGTFTVNYRVL